MISDTRQITGFARDISFVSEENYISLTPPSALQGFADDLKNKDLEYSGFYEDGWVAETSYVVLQQPSNRSVLWVSLMVPEINGRLAASSVVLVVDGQSLEEKAPPSGRVSFERRLKASGRV